VGKYAEAEIVCREWMEYVNHIIVSEKCVSMMTLRKALACALDCQGRHADALGILWQCFNEFRSSESGDIHINETVRLIGDCFVHRGEFDRAVDVLQRILDMAFESDDSETSFTLHCRVTLAKAIFRQGDMKKTEALAMFEKYLPLLKRLLGPEHPHVLSASAEYVAPPPLSNSGVLVNIATRCALSFILFECTNTFCH
jgi:hypothetical protein